MRYAGAVRWMTSCLVCVVLSGCATGGGGTPPGTRTDGGADATMPGDSAVPDSAVDGGLPDGARMDSGRADAGPVDTGPPPTDDCTGAADGTPCAADGDGCTQDSCSTGRCVVGALASCDDDLACTTDLCVALSPTSFRCEARVSAGFCVVDAACHADGAPQPGTECFACDPGADATRWSVDVGGGCADGDTCTTADVCAADGTCAGTPTVDGMEANDSRSVAHSLGNISDGDSYPAGTFSASLFPDGDEDWYVFNDSDDFGGLIFPKVELSGVPAGANYDLCAYVSCESSFNSLTCTDGTESTRDGLTGCCSSLSGSASETVRINHDCSGTDDSADIFVRVFQVAGPASCSSYTVRWGDD